MRFPLVKLDDAITFIRGVTFTPDDQVEPFAHGSTVVMRTKNVQVAGLDQGDLIAVPSGFVRRREQFLKEGDILVSSANSWELVGKASYVPSLNYGATAGGFISIVRAKESIIDARYLYHWITCPPVQHKIRHCGRQTTNISNLDVGRFKELEIPLPPLPEQKRIAAILDKADAIRRKRQQAIQLADDFLRAVFLDMFGDPVINPKGWEPVTLGDLLHFAKDGPHVSPSYSDEGIPFLSTRHVKPSGVVWEDLKYVTHEEANVHWKKCKPELGDVLYTKGGTTGIACPVDFEEDFAVWVHVALLRPKKCKVNYVWLSQMLNSKYCYDQSQKQTRGATNKDLGLTRMIDINMYCPPIAEQDRFVEIKTGVESHTKKSEIFNDLRLFDSLTQKAFSGQL